MTSTSDAVVAGLLLTGGASRRLGRDKATVAFGGERCAARVAGVLATVARPVLEIGPGVSGLRSVPDAQPGAGPLAALVTGCRALGTERTGIPVLVLACDVPLVTAALLRLLATWPGTGSAVPLVDGRPQPLCARFSAAAVARATAALAGGERSLRPLLASPDVELLDASVWGPVADPVVFVDIDTPEDLARVEAVLG
ncbi:MAG TPA: molybdenum cofactor guanylyltransferase [Acidimicrobiales bacterium]|nr:molybdenum cofactor guanylyltransferase [Acidimicrobiales bacterium]